MTVRGGTRAAIVVACAGVTAWLLWFPMRHASAYLDDYVFIALGRHIANPFALLVGDGLGSFFFRPFALFLWAVSVKVLGNAAPPQLLLNMLLHAGNGALLYALARRLDLGHAAAAASGLLFVVHPAAFSAAAWLSDRFDIFALLFGLLALIATESWSRLPRAAVFAASCAAMAAALLSKENAFAFLPPALLILAWTGPAPGASRRHRIVLGCALVATGVLAGIARVVILRDVTGTMFLRDGPVVTLVEGTLKWLRYSPRFVGVDAGSRFAMGLQLVAGLGFAAALVLPATWRGMRTARFARVAAVSTLLMLGAAASQAPVVHASPIHPYDGGPFLFDPLAASRFYYVPLAGLALLVAAALDAMSAASRPGVVRAASALLIAAALVSMLSVSRGIAREWQAFIESEDAPLVRAAVATVKAQAAAPPGCKIYLLGLPKDAISVTSLIDTAVKQGLDAGDPHAACFIQTEHAPWYHLVESTHLGPGAQAPLQDILFNGKPYPPLPIANLTYFYLKAVDGPAIVRDPKATFYLFEQGRFRDVTREVRRGAMPVRFFDNRPLF